MPRFCVIHAEDAVERWKKRNYSDMFIDGLTQEGDSWTVVNPATGDSLASILQDNYDGIVITGSHYNVRDQLPWYDALINIIRHVADTGAPNLYGGCFGHQLVAHALGGVVGQSDQFVMKAEDVHFLPSFAHYSGSEEVTTLNLLEVHGDCVVTLPPEAKLVAQSASCAHEAYVVGSKNNILCAQSHPEFDVQYCFTEILWDLCKSRIGSTEAIAEAKSTLDAYADTDAKRFLTLISTFLRQKRN
ncbi:hypothetical protein H310_06447 [Aphanomyces invadans]|uniref:Glutamine amidotransferase domain-containing protein n=1 Tax=Aphanomyces invadans TaxID=157072 RepID=A0A024U8J4_9STRA|nr:hypothetical protein H310_06447 [Aphanomyces invadans]ETW01888.1 hypothetical protein H310_06447 [Aphanomyces invadans]RHY28348.1 hypothetical protein DYB32_006035 [Aphanomyces invadans]|eukprot:XP_008869736.1 hypothetical protein H310_06447 [Aphanomyces invadans]